MADRLNMILAESLRDVLESMCFAMVDGLADSPVEEALPCASVALSFKGDCRGTFWLSVPADAAREISSSFSGDSEVSRKQIGLVVSELANIACGSTLSRYADRTIFDLGAPSFSWISQSSDFPKEWRTAERVNLQIGANLVSASISLEPEGLSPILEAEPTPRKDCDLP